MQTFLSAAHARTADADLPAAASASGELPAAASSECEGGAGDAGDCEAMVFDEARIRRIREAFDQRQSGGRVEIKKVWELLFTTEERIEYGCTATCPAHISQSNRFHAAEHMLALARPAPHA